MNNRAISIVGECSNVGKDAGVCWIHALWHVSEVAVCVVYMEVLGDDAVLEVGELPGHRDQLQPVSEGDEQAEHGEGAGEVEPEVASGASEGGGTCPAATSGSTSPAPSPCSACSSPSDTGCN